MRDLTSTLIFDIFFSKFFCLNSAEFGYFFPMQIFCIMHIVVGRSFAAVMTNETNIIFANDMSFSMPFT